MPICKYLGLGVRIRLRGRKVEGLLAPCITQGSFDLTYEGCMYFIVQVYTRAVKERPVRPHYLPP